MAHDGTQSGGELRGAVFQFFTVREGEAAEDFFAMRSERKEDLAAVVRVGRALHEFTSFHPVHQSHGALMLEEEGTGEIAHGAGLAGGHSFDGEKRLVLPGFETLDQGGAFAEMQKAPDLIAEVRQFLVFDGRESRAVQ